MGRSSGRSSRLFPTCSGVATPCQSNGIAATVLSGWVENRFAVSHRRSGELADGPLERGPDLLVAERLDSRLQVYAD